MLVRKLLRSHPETLEVVYYDVDMLYGNEDVLR